uniref:NADH-ubiquinone oxidoreductase chain 4 n=1 Tax=Lucidina sp. FM13 TaxID=2596686 RepID=A0A5C0PY54_9COLE|nr:NADH dehydrogenase subunit 4 [Lucidina sp. FM13]
MMKFIFMMIFMIPLCFKKNMVFIFQFIYLLMFIMFFIQFIFSNFQLGISYFLGCDYISYFMILLSIWIVMLMVLSSNMINNLLFSFKNFFNFTILLLLFSLFLTFCSMNMFLFYVFFELSMIPTLFLILGWGYQPERIQAGMYMFMYTLMGSLPMMISLFYIFKESNSIDYFFINSVESLLIYIMMLILFLVKLPLYFFHLWLPKAHVEAPISGSMILAGVMLKLGGYGLIRFMKLFVMLGLKLNIFIILIGTVGGSLISLLCLRQEDMKSLIAYSSVAHMGLMVGGMLTLNIWGILGSLIIMISHGLCSSGLFCLANISYERTSTRSMYLNKGMLNLMPSMSLMWFLLCSSNMSSPPSLNLVGEILLINSLVSFSWLLMICIFFMSFLGGAYSLYLYVQVQHGQLNFNVYSFSLGNFREFLLLIFHWLPLNLIFLVMNVFIM